jgi:hypothetical protein
MSTKNVRLATFCTNSSGHPVPDPTFTSILSVLRALVEASVSGWLDGWRLLPKKVLC